MSNLKSIYVQSKCRGNIPQGFTYVKNTINNKYYFKCCNTKVVNGHIRECQFVVRSDYGAKKLDHDCIFERLSFLTENDLNIQNIRKYYIEALVKFIGKSKLSINSSRSKHFRKFCFQLIKLGCIIYSNSLENYGFNELIPNPSFNKIRNTFVNKSLLKKEKKIKKLAQYKFVSLAVDSGTVEGKKFLDIYVGNPSENCKFVLMHSASNVTNTVDCITEQINRCLKLCYNYGLQVTGITSDNLTSQVIAINNIINRRYYFDLIHIRCACHILNLVLNDLSKKSDYYKNYQVVIHSLSKLYNSCVDGKKITTRCPSVIPTRWVYDINIVAFLYAHQNEIEIIVSKSNPHKLASDYNIDQKIALDLIHNHLRFILEFLSPIKTAISLLESEKSGLIEGYLVFTKLREYMCFLMNNVYNNNETYMEIIKTYIEEFDFRVNKSINIGLMKLAWSLSLIGRSEMREKLKNCIEFDSVNVKSFAPINSPYDNIHFDLKIRDQSIQYSYNFNINTGAEDDEENTINNLAKENDIKGIWDEENETEYHADIENNDNASGIFNSLVDILIDFCLKMKLNSKKVSDQYRKYIYNSLKRHITQSNAESVTASELWRILENDDDFKELAQAARMILSLCISEAICERGFSLRKLTMNKNQRRSLEDLINSKLYY